MEIFNDVPVPEIAGRGAKGKENPLLTLEKGQCAFVAIGDEDVNKLKARLRGRIDMARRAAEGRKFALRAAPHPILGVPALGVWRTE